MIFRLSHTNGLSEDIVSIDTLEQLMCLQEKCGHELIVGRNTDGQPYIEIYDDYRE